MKCNLMHMSLIHDKYIAIKMHALFNMVTLTIGHKVKQSAARVQLHFDLLQLNIVSMTPYSLIEDTLAMQQTLRNRYTKAFFSNMLLVSSEMFLVFRELPSARFLSTSSSTPLSLSASSSRLYCVCCNIQWC